MTELKHQNQVRDYLRCYVSDVDQIKDPLTFLIESHKRQRNIIQEMPRPWPKSKGMRRFLWRLFKAKEIGKV